MISLQISEVMHLGSVGKEHYQYPQMEQSLERCTVTEDISLPKGVYTGVVLTI